MNKLLNLHSVSMFVDDKCLGPVARPDERFGLYIVATVLLSYQVKIIHKILTRLGIKYTVTNTKQASFD